MERSRLLLIDPQGNLSALFKKKQLTHCDITISTMRESEIIVHLKSHNLAVFTMP